MILLRPYVAYQISAKNGSLARDPDQVSRILQRLIKKKETHMEDRDEAMELIQATDPKFILPFVFIVLLSRRIGWLLSLFEETITSGIQSTVFQVSPTNQHYRLISRLQI